MKQRTAPKRLFLLILIAILPLNSACGMLSGLPEKVIGILPESDSDGAPSIVLEGDCPSNNKQYESTVWIGTYGGRLLFYPIDARINSMYRTQFSGWLCVFGDRGIQKKCHLAGGGSLWYYPIVFGSVGKYLYYTDGSDKLMCCDLETFKEKTLYRGRFVTLWTGPFWAEDGSVYFPIAVPPYDENGKRNEDPMTLYLHVKGDQVLGEIPLEEGYELGESIYYPDYDQLNWEFCAMDIVRENGDGARETAIPGKYGGCSVIPTDYGLLVHHLQAQDLKENGVWEEAVVLYLIQETGEIAPLFQFESLYTISAVAVSGSCAYLSVIRGTEAGDFTMTVSHADDPMNGTYRIDLEDQTCVKISDEIYRGLYIFDDTYLYACDETGSIYQLDLDGNIVAVLLQVHNMGFFSHATTPDPRRMSD